MPLDARYRATGRTHAGLILVSTKMFPQNRGFVLAVTNALAALLATEDEDQVTQGQVAFLSRQ